MNEEMYEVTVAGTITFPGIQEMVYGENNKLFLLSPHPLPKDSWMKDDAYTWHVAVEGGKATHIVTNLPYFVSYASSGRTIKIRNSN